MKLCAVSMSNRMESSARRKHAGSEPLLRDALAASNVRRPPPAGGVRTFRAGTMPEALRLVKQALGAEAVILGTRTVEPDGLRGLLSNKRIEITAAPADPALAPPRLKPAAAAHRRIRATPSPSIPEMLQPHYLALVQSEVAEELAAELVRSAAVRGQSAETALRERIAALLPATRGIELSPGRSRRVAFVGPAGAGKTTTIAKLAAQFALRDRKRVVLVTLDTRRLGADEQLRRFAEVLGMTCVAVRSPADLDSARSAAAAADLALIDTPGLGLRDAGALDGLRGSIAALAPDETHLVVPAGLAVGMHSRLSAAFAPLGFSHVVLTRLDDAAGFGVILEVMQKLHGRLSYVTTGQNIPQDLIPACSRHLAELILPARTTGSSS
jgi:flagellar biosynthesis protein FlhF